MKSDKINIYYWGADKFTIILKDCNNIQEIKKISEDIKTNIAGNIKLNNQNIPITSSIGISICPIHSENINDHILAHELCDTYLNSHPQYKNIKKQFDYHTIPIKKFGRYPHRNKVMGRKSTDEEKKFLSSPNSSW